MIPPGSPIPPTASPLPVLDGRHRMLLAGLGVIFLAALLLRLNGWSLPAWHAFIDGSPAIEVVAGKVQTIRSDDFLLDLPTALAQASHQPRFPLINRNIGSGEFMAAPIEAPAGVFITLFRPFTWGFLLGRDVGLAWKWWGLVLGLFYALFLVFMLVSENRFGLSAWASLAIVVSPYFQFWSFHKAEIAIHWASAFVAAACVLAARRPWVVWIGGAALGWSLAAMALDQIYPPIAVTLGWLLPTAGAAWYWNRRRRQTTRTWSRQRLGATLLAAAIVAASLSFFFAGSGKYLELIRNTVYPGRRFSLGGDLPLWTFLGDNFLVQAWDHGHPFLGSTSEGAGFFYVFPALWILVLIPSIRRRKILEPWNVLLALYTVGLLFYASAGFPRWLAEGSLMRLATANRVQMGLGLANQLMLVAACSSPQLRGALSPRLRWVAAGLWLAVLGAGAIWFHRHWPYSGMGGIWTGLAFHAVLAGLFLGLDWPVLGMAFLASCSLVYTVGFNPWVRGGSEYLLHNPLSTEMEQLSSSDPGARWAVYGGLVLPNLPRILGIKSIGGYYGYPDFKTWELFDPSGAYRSVYNQAGYVTFTFTDNPTPSFESPQPGVVTIKASPLCPAFSRAGVRYFLVADESEIEAFTRTGGFDRLFSSAGKAVFRRK